MVESRLAWRAALVLVANLFVTSSLWAADSILYSGSYTSGASKGIYAWRFHSSTARLDPLGLMAATSQPAHLWASPEGKHLYAVNWEDEGGVSAFRIDASTGKLTFLNRVSAQGSKPNQVVVHPSGRIAVAVNYNSGNVVAYKILAGGKLSEAFYIDQHEPGAKAHGVEFSPDGKYLYVAELGLDRVYSYRIDADKPTIVAADPAYTSTHSRAGPRRLQITHDGRFLYVNHETDGEVSVFAAENGRLKELQTVSTLPSGFSAPNKTAEIIISADDRHLYVSNRGHDSIAVFAIDRQTGFLTLQANVNAGGRTPRNLRLDPTGGYLFCSNEGSGTITVFKVDKVSGSLTLLDVKAEIDTPGGLYFVKAD